MALIDFNPRSKLQSYVGSKDNNFNLMRLVAAFLVLFSHSFALSTGLSSEEPLRTDLGITFGHIAVDIFFVASGFLVTGSLLARGSVVTFLRARALRVYPGLIVSVLLTVFVFGAFVTTLPFTSYISNTSTITFLLKNTSLVTNVAFTLPGVFEANPWKLAVNASLWTLPYEIAMYVGLASLWLIWSRLKKNWLGEFGRILVVVAALSLAAHVASHFFWRDSGLLRLTAMFFVGASFYFLRDRITLSPGVFAVMGIALVLSALHRQVFFIVYTFTLPYLVFCLAYLPKGRIRAYNKVGDYSYGLYIYAFPIQQSLAFFMPGIGVTEMLFLSTLLTGFAAVISWHVIESRALRLK